MPPSFRTGLMPRGILKIGHYSLRNAGSYLTSQVMKRPQALGLTIHSRPGQVRERLRIERAIDPQQTLAELGIIDRAR